MVEVVGGCPTNKSIAPASLFKARALNLGWLSCTAARATAWQLYITAKTMTQK